MPSSERLDVAIIGGGISGLYSAWRLSAANPHRKIALFEGSQRIGGRIDTAPVGDPATAGASGRVEFGAMRFLDNQVLVRELLKKFGLATEVFPDSTLRQYYVRGVQVAFDANGNPTNLPYHLAPDEPTNPVLLIKQLLGELVPNAFDLQPNQWEDAMRKATFQGRPLSDWGFWNVMEQIASNEAYSMMDDGFGNQSAFGNINAAMATRLISLPLQDSLENKVYRPVNGWISIVEALDHAIASLGVCPVYRGSRLTALLPASSGGVQLIFEGADGKHSMVETEHVVLAMPRRALSLIDVKGLIQPETWRDKLSCVEGVPVFKLCLAYDNPWWAKVEGWTGGGYAYTDLPVRQVFYGLGVAGTADQNVRVMMATYCDEEATQFWTGLASLSGHKVIGDSDSMYKTGNVELTASVNRQLKVLMNLTADPPSPIWTGYVDWSQDPYGGAWHEWRAGYNTLDSIPAMRHPFPELPVYICGEAYSWFQGWIEGALMSAERLLQDHFALPWPSDWLDTDYSLGP